MGLVNVPFFVVDFGHQNTYLLEMISPKVVDVKHLDIYQPLLIGGVAIPLKNMSSSIGMMIFPIDGKIKHVPVTTNQLISIVS